MENESIESVVDECIRRRMQSEDMDLYWTTKVPNDDSVQEVQIPDENLRFIYDTLGNIIKQASGIKSCIEKGQQTELIQSMFMQISTACSSLAEAGQMLSITQNYEDTQGQQFDQDEGDQEDEYHMGDGDYQMMYGDIML